MIISKLELIFNLKGGLSVFLKCSDFQIVPSQLTIARMSEICWWAALSSPWRYLISLLDVSNHFRRSSSISGNFDSVALERSSTSAAASCNPKREIRQVSSKESRYCNLLRDGHRLPLYICIKINTSMLDGTGIELLYLIRYALIDTLSKPFCVLDHIRA